MLHFLEVAVKCVRGGGVNPALRGLCFVWVLCQVRSDLALSEAWRSRVEPGTALGGYRCDGAAGRRAGWFAGA